MKLDLSSEELEKSKLSGHIFKANYFFSSDISVHTPHQLVAVMRHFAVCQTPINNIKKKVVDCDFGCRLFGSCVWWAVSSVDHFSLLEGFCIYGAVSRVYRWITSLPLWGGCGEVGLPQCHSNISIIMTVTELKVSQLRCIVMLLVSDKYKWHRCLFSSVL